MARSAKGPLHGRAALVTGAAKRVGAAIARRLAEAGCDVAIHYRTSEEEATDLVRQLRALGVRAATVSGNLADRQERQAVLPAAAKALGKPLTVLVNNASSFPERRLDELRWSDLQQDLAVNAWAPFELTMALARQLPAKKTGHVVNLIDARIVDDDRRHVGYFLAKRMLADFTRLCAIELAPRVLVNGVSPGPTLPPPGMDVEQGDQLMERLRKQLPLQQTDTPEDLAEAVLFLATSRSITGHVLSVDGGRHLGRGIAPSSTSSLPNLARTRTPPTPTEATVPQATGGRPRPAKGKVGATGDTTDLGPVKPSTKPHQRRGR